MKRTKPIDPRDADRLSRAILAANELDHIVDVHEGRCVTIMHSDFAESLPTKSYDALLEYIGWPESRSDALANLPFYEKAQFRQKFKSVADMGAEIRRLRRMAKVAS